MLRNDGAGLRPATAVTLALAAGAALAGSLVVNHRRTAEQARRIAEHPDDAPPRTRRRPEEPGAVVSRSVTINKPRQELYAFWRDFGNLPRFMENVRAVSVSGERTTWTIGAPLGATVEVVTEITEDRPGEIIAWRSIPESSIRTEGSARFMDAPAGRGTIVEASLRYDPPGGEVGRLIAKLFQREPAIQARRELKRLKMLMETGEIATSANRKADAA